MKSVHGPTGAGEGFTVPGENSTVLLEVVIITFDTDQSNPNTTLAAAIKNLQIKIISIVGELSLMYGSVYSCIQMLFGSVVSGDYHSSILSSIRVLTHGKWTVDS